MNYLRKNTANILTLSNMFCGFAGIINSLYGDIEYGAYFILFAALFDFLDGFVARKLNIRSELGKQLDSLADIISFGVLPATILHVLMLKSHANWTEIVLFTDIPALSFLPFSLILFAAIRLANFNIDDEQQVVFKGLPTPAVALFVAGLPLMMRYDLYIFNYESIYFKNIILNPWIIISVTAFLSYMMVAPIKMMSFKIKNFSVKDNKLQLTFIVVFILLFVFLLFLALPLIILIYIIVSYTFKNKVK